MTTHTFTMHNTDATKALQVTDAAGLYPTVYIAPGNWNDVSMADGTVKMIELVDPAIVPQGGGGRAEE